MAERQLLLDRDNFPSNTYQDQMKRAKKAEGEKPPNKPIAKGRKEKQTLGKRIKGTFIHEDRQAIGSYIWDDVVAPAIRDTIFAVAIGSLSMALFGTVRNTARPGSTIGGNFRYDQAYNARQQKAQRNRDSFARVYFDTKAEADDVLEMMREMVDEYGSAAVGDMYELAGAGIEAIDWKWGWTSLKRASVIYERDGYTIDLPPAKPME